MDVEFGDEGLSRLASDQTQDAGYSRGVGKAYRNRINFIRQATDERDFYAMKSLRFEKLKGKRSHQRSMRLNNQWRLVVEIEQNPKRIRIVSIEDYH